MGDGSSALILSVMISASDSSFSTQSPSLLSQDPTVPSATDSPKRGIFTGVGIYHSFLGAAYDKNVGNGRVVAYTYDGRVLGRVIPGSGLLDAGKFNDDDTLRLPVTL